MFTYEDTLAIHVEIDRPDVRYYLLLDHQLNGCKSGLDQAQVYIRQAYMIHNIEFHDIYMRLATKLLNDMEVLSRLIHLFHGEDDRYYDESNDDTPVFEFILPLEEECNTQEDKHHVNNDMTASIMRNMQFEDERIKLYEKLIQYIDDTKAKEVLHYLKTQAEKSFHTLKNLMTILTTHTEVKDFGLGDSHNAFDLDTSNYFDKPNPTFINPNEVEDFKQFK